RFITSSSLCEGPRLWLQSTKLEIAHLPDRFFATHQKRIPAMSTSVKRPFRASCVVLCVLSCALASAVGAESPLRWKFKQGETLNYVLERGVEGKMNLTGSEIAFKMGMAFDISWTATSVASDGAAQVDLTVDRIQINMASPLGGNLTFDSSD